MYICKEVKEGKIESEHIKRERPWIVKQCCWPLSVFSSFAYFQLENEIHTFVKQLKKTQKMFKNEMKTSSKLGHKNTKQKKKTKK